MKNKLTFTTIILFLFEVGTQLVFSDTATRLPESDVKVSSTVSNLNAQLNDISRGAEFSAVLNWIANAGKLWPDQPDAYFAVMSDNALKTIKSCVQRELSSVSFDIKNRDSLLAFAKQLGMVKIVQISDWQKKFPGGVLSGSYEMIPPEERPKLQKLIARMDKENRLRHIQTALESVGDGPYKEVFEKAVRTYVLNHPEDKKFIEEMSTLTNLIKPAGETSDKGSSP